MGDRNKNSLFVRKQQKILVSTSWTNVRRADVQSFLSGSRFNSGQQPSEHLQTITAEPRKLLKAFGFACLFIVGSFTGATILQYESWRAKAEKSMNNLREHKWFRQKSSKSLKDNPLFEDKLFATICGLNVLVFGLWKIPALQKTMLTYFAANPASRIICWPMFLSTFSHYSVLHLLANMYVLHNFSSVAAPLMGKEQFLGLYLSAGVWASLTSNVFKTAIRTGGFSLGASGAILGIIAYVCLKKPDSQLQIAFIPQFQFSAESALKGIVLFDLLGCVFKWRFLDHAAHLGGTMFGTFWFYIGEKHLWPKREILLKHWHMFRSK